jgi:hypothetical protein
VSVFVSTNHLLLRNPAGGVEDVAAMAAAHFRAIFCNIGDFEPDEWLTVRQRARDADCWCGPWLRTADEWNAFDPDGVRWLVDVADDWGSPLIVNTESEAKGTGSNVTQFIADVVGARDAAISVEAWPFANVDWTPLARYPILPQIFPAESPPSADPEACRAEWYAYGAQCVVFTFGAYGDQRPEQYERLSPYGVYTADDMAQDYAAWSPLGTRDPYAPSTNGGTEMETIGSQHGITAMANIFREQWPEKTKKPDPDDVSTWGAIDKLERTLTILASDHDDQAATA